MKRIFIRIQRIFLITLMLFAGAQVRRSEAAVTRIELVEGSVLIGEVVSFSNGIYTVRLKNGEEVKVSEKSVKDIRYEGSSGQEGRPPSQPTTTTTVDDLRLAGSNTIGERLVPELAYAYVSSRGGQNPQWLGGQPENERRLVVSGSPRARIPHSVQIAAHGSATAFVALKEGKADIGMASRSINDKELTDLSALGDLAGDRSEHTIALDGLAIIVHPKNPVQALTMEQIAMIFSGKITDWSQVGGRSGAIKLNARDDKSGTFDTLKHLVLDPRNLKLSSEAQRFESSTELSNEVASNPNAVGFIGLSYVLSSRALKILECDLAYEPSPFAVKSEEYPLARRLYLYTPERPGSSFVSDFVEFSLSDEGQQVVEKEGFVNQSIQPDSANTQQVRLAAAGLYTQDSEALKDLLRTTRGASRLSVTFRFRRGSEKLDTKANRDLDRLARFMKTPAAQGKELLLLGFADNRGSYKANQGLSQRRAEAVAEALRSKGGKVALVKGFSSEAPVACNTTDIGAERNRHVEVWWR